MNYYRWRKPDATRTYNPGRYWFAVLLPVVVVGYALLRVWLSVR